MACFFQRESLLDVYDHLTLRFNENPDKSRYALRQPNKTTIREDFIDISFKISNYPPLMAARVKARSSSTQLNDPFRTHKISDLSRWVKDHCPLFLLRERSCLLFEIKYADLSVHLTVFVKSSETRCLSRRGAVTTSVQTIPTYRGRRQTVLLPPDAPSRNRSRGYPAVFFSFRFVSFTLGPLLAPRNSITLDDRR